MFTYFTSTPVHSLSSIRHRPPRPQSAASITTTPYNILPLCPQADLACFPTSEHICTRPSIFFHLKNWGAGSYETSVPIYHATRLLIPKEIYLYITEMRLHLTWWITLLSTRRTFPLYPFLPSSFSSILSLDKRCVI